MTLLELLALRRTFNATLLVEDFGQYYQVKAYIPDLIETSVNKNTADATIVESLSPVYNLPIAKEEFRFTTHDFTNPASWDGRTNGDPAASWAAANDGVSYDDVNYRWLDENDDPVCHLVPTESGVGSLWKDESNNTVVSFNATSQHWERTDNNANVTSSRWSIIPYPNTKMEIVMANAIFGADAEMEATGALHYKIYMNIPPYGVIPVRDFVYSSPLLMQLNANNIKELGQDIYCSYDYRTTVHPIIDSLAQMRLDISLDNNLPVTSATNRPGRAVFIGKKITSF
jgi:hypothetical protein